jgi:23S rRNA (uracil1939-C5)-methyltransferase
MVTFVTAERDFRQVTHLGKGLQRQVPEVVSINQNVNPGTGNAILGRETLRMIGAPDLLDLLGDLRLRIAPASFFQVNHEQAARIYALVRQWAGLSREETAVDLYCGIGGIALTLARDAGRVIGVEVVADAVNNAKDNARLNHLANCSFLAGDAEELLQDLTHDGAPGAVAVVNPPRNGCEPGVLKALAGLAPRLLLYVSCEPETLARDLNLLAHLGYRTEEIQPVDMFPQTAHIESVARLVPAPMAKVARRQPPGPAKGRIAAGQPGTGRKPGRSPSKKPKATEAP